MLCSIFIYFRFRSIARGQDISDASNFYLALNEKSKVQLHLIDDEQIKNCSAEIPEDISPLLGAMKVHQVFTENAGILKYRDLSCFCQRGFCSCMDPKEYIPLKAINEESSPTIFDSTILTNISNVVQQPKKTFYSTVYSSDSDDDTPLKIFRY